MRFCCSLIGCGLVVSSAFGGNSSTHTATVNASGPRKGGVYLNVEGTGTGKYECFGVADFGAVKPGAGHKLRLTLAQSNASFTKDGPVKIYLCDGSVSVAEGSPLKFQDKKLGTFGAETMHLTFLGSVDFKQGPAKVDSFTFSLTAPIAKILKTAKNVRIVIVPASPTVAATYAGFEHRTFKHPQLDILP